MTKWSESLIKERISQELFQEPPGQGTWSREEKQRVQDIAFLCEGVFRSDERVKKALAAIKKLRKDAPGAARDVADHVLEELKEIRNDLKFAKSRRGKFILFANDYAQEVYKTLRKDDALAGVMIGSHPEHEQLTVAGSVEDAADIAKVAQLLAEHPPGVPVQFHVLLQPSAD